MEIFDTTEEKIAHLKLLTLIAICDNNMEEHEKEQINTLKRLYGLSDLEINVDETNGDKELRSLLSGVTSMKNKLALIQDLLSCAYADGIYSDKEKEKMRQIGEIIGVGSKKINEIEILNQEIQDAYKKLALALEFDS